MFLLPLVVELRALPSIHLTVDRVVTWMRNLLERHLLELAGRVVAGCVVGSHGHVFAGDPLAVIIDNQTVLEFHGWIGHWRRYAQVVHNAFAV